MFEFLKKNNPKLLDALSFDEILEIEQSLENGGVYFMGKGKVVIMEFDEFVIRNYV